MRKAPHLIFLALGLFSVRCFADTVTLATGEKLEGKITAESVMDITMEVKVSDTISDERVIKRGDIKNIEKTTPDEAAFDGIKNLKPDPNVAEPATIDQSITALSGFVSQYPLSAHTAEAKAALEAFQKEKQHLDAGEVKYYGRWISKAEAGKRAVQVDAENLLAKMIRLTASGDLTGALNAFDDIEKKCSGSRAYPQAIALARQVLAVLGPQVAHDIQVRAHDEDLWNQGVIIEPEPTKSQTMAAHKLEQDKYKAMVDAAKDKKWPPLLPHSSASLDALAAEIPTESARIATLPVDKMNASIQRSDKAQEALDSNDLASVDALLAEATTLWPQNAEVAYVNTEVADSKEKAAAAAAIAAKKTPTPAPKQVITTIATPTPVPTATPAPAPPPQTTWLEFFQTIPGALCIVGGALVLFGVAAVAQKLRKPQGEV